MIVLTGEAIAWYAQMMGHAERVRARLDALGVGEQVDDAMYASDNEVLYDAFFNLRALYSQLWPSEGSSDAHMLGKIEEVMTWMVEQGTTG